MKRHINKVKYDFCFRKWTRKSYGIFNSLGKVIKIGVLVSGFGTVILRPNSLSAQVNQTDSLPDKEVVLDGLIVSGSKADGFLAPQLITAVISRNEIEQAAVQTLQDLLLYVQSVDVRMRGSNGVQADVSLRGGTFDQTTILLNGINITDPQTGHHSLNNPIPIEIIERIEVLSGTSSLTYNTVGFTGCINIVTITPENNAADLSLSAGMYGYVRASLNYFMCLKKWTLTISGDINKSDGFIENTDYLHGNTFFRLQYKDKKKGNFDLQGGFQQKNFGANSFYSARYKDQYEQTRVFLASGSYQLIVQKWKFWANAYCRNHYDHFQLFRYDAPAWYSGHNNHQTLVIGANAQTAYRYKWGNTSFGVDFRQEQLLSNTLGDDLAKPVSVSFVDDNAFYTKHKIRQHVGFQLQQTYQQGIYKTSLGGKINISNDYGINGSLGWNGILYLPKKLELNYFVQNTYRLPTFTDLYYNSPTQVSNPYLQPEQAIAAEIGLNWMPAKWKTSLNLFYRYGFRIIDWVRITSEEKWFSQNTTHVQAMGTDVSATYFPKNSYISLIGLQYSYLFVNKDTNAYHSLYATDYLRHQIKLNFHHKIVWKLYAGWQFNYHDRKGTYLNINTNTEQPYKPYLLCNLKINLKLEKINVFVEANNLFNSKYFDLGNIPQPGIWIKAGISVKIE